MMRRLWPALKLGALWILCPLAIWAEWAYRIPGPTAMVLLPWVGVGLMSLSIVAVLARIVRHAPDGDPLRRAILMVDRVDTALMVAFICHGLFLFENGAGSSPEVISRPSEVVARGGGGACGLDGPRYRGWCQSRTGGPCNRA